MFNRLKSNVISRAIGRFIGQAPDSIKAHINVDEAVRIAITALLAGGGVYGVIFAELAHLPQLVTPADAAFATAVVTLISETIRRFGHGVALPAPTATVPIRRPFSAN